MFPQVSRKFPRKLFAHVLLLSLLVLLLAFLLALLQPEAATLRNMCCKPVFADALESRKFPQVSRKYSRKVQILYSPR